MRLDKRILLAGVLVIAVVGAVFTVRNIQANQRTQVQVADQAKKIGPENAVVKLIVYSDFQCPACERAHTPIAALQRQFPEHVQIEFRNYPLERAHRWAMSAAVFAQCAARQDKFWPMHDRLYREQSKWSNSEDAIPFLVQYAHEIGLEQKSLEQCLQDPKVVDEIRAEHDSGDAKQVQSTPTIFINNHRIVGGLDFVAKAQSMVLEELRIRAIKAPENLEPLQMPSPSPVPMTTPTPLAPAPVTETAPLS